MCLVIQSNLTLNSPSWYWNNFDKENNLFTTWFDTSLFWCYLSDVNHPWLFIFCHLSLDNEKCFDSVIYWNFLSHNMFRPSGPDHVLARTAKIQGKPHRKWMWGLSQIKTNYMAEKVKVKALYTRKLRHCFKKVAPQGRDCPSPPRPRAPPC